MRTRSLLVVGVVLALILLGVTVPALADQFDPVSTVQATATAQVVQATATAQALAVQATDTEEARRATATAQHAPVQDLSDVGELMGLLAGLAFLVEAVVELAVASWLWKGNQEMIDTREVVLKLVTSTIGVGLAWGYNIDLIGAVAEIFGVAPANPVPMQIMGNILTGILIGRGAQWFHDIGSAWLGLDGNIPSLVQVGAVTGVGSDDWPEQ